MELVHQSPILVNQVYKQLSNAIGTCELQPGQRLRQAEIADMLGVSRQPISHALQLLKRDGLVEDYGRKGVMVAPIDPRQMLDIYQIRASLDALAARLAATRVAAGEIAPIELDALDAIIEEAVDFSDETPALDRVSADIAFHNKIVELSGNQRIAETLAPYFTHIMRSMTLVLNRAKFREKAWKDHKEIARLIRSGDPAAGDFVRQHAESAGQETYEELLSEESYEQSA